MIKFKIVQGIEGYHKYKDFRYAILAEEMGFADGLEDIDNNALHMYGVENDEIICCARLYNIADYTYCIDKIAVKKEDRLQYVADTMLRAFEDKTVTLMGGLIVTEVPENAWEFFKHEEYATVGDEYEINGVKYLKMKRDLTKIRGCRGGCNK